MFNVIKENLFQDPEWHYAKHAEGRDGIVPTNRLAVRGVQLQAMP